MATGIQTGMNRGSRSGISRNSQLGKGAPGGGGGPLGKLGDIWKGLGKGAKIGISVLVAVLVFAGSGLYLYSASNAYVKLYPAKLSDNDIQEISSALTSMQISHNIDLVEGIMLHPDQRIPAQVKLAEMNLPRQPVLTHDKVEGGMGKTAAEQKAIRQQLLEGDITLALRQMEGVNDAMVKLAIPDKTYFQDDNKAVTARVLLNLKQGHDPSREQIGGMLSLVAASVPELETKNVQIIDSQGVNLSARVPSDENGFVASGTQLEIQALEERRLQEKAQEMLERALPGKTKVGVNLEMDFSKREEQRYTPGGAADDGVVVSSRQVTREKLNKGEKGSDSDGELLAGGNKPTDGSDYVNEKQAENFEVAKHTIKTVDTGFRIKRITASVVADNVSDDELQAISGLVKRAIGADESRGDEVVVENLPFQRENMFNNHATLGLGGANQNQPAAGSALSGQHLAAGVAVGAIFVLGLLGVFFVKQHKVQADQGAIISSGSSSIMATSITDHFTEKSGKTNAPASSAATQVNTTDELEKLVKERPTKVAEMLKSTWLSQS
ncbi:MAG: flagellar basal-body MS-ring/collar protein FliF [Vulcanimicrobiota bacterium]